MKVLNMELSPKAVRYMMEALEFRIDAYQKQLEMENIDDDEASDITHDMMFLQSLFQALSETHEAELLLQR
jgi:putative heme degradation protein